MGGGEGRREASWREGSDTLMLSTRKKTVWGANEERMKFCVRGRERGCEGERETERKRERDIKKDRKEGGCNLHGERE